MMYLDLDELPKLFERRWLWSATRPSLAWFRRADYLGDPKVSLDEAVRQLVKERTGRRLDGPIRVLTHMRHFGYVFNPLSIYFCFDDTGTSLDTVVAEVRNTPWGESHAYLLTPEMNLAHGGGHHYQFEKDFHVSPFMDMAMRYDWKMSVPGKSLAVHMENQVEARRIFDVSMTMKRREITSLSLAGCLIRRPFITAQVIIGIYWQALRLWIKRVPFHTHPAKRRSTGEAIGS